MWLGKPYPEQGHVDATKVGPTNAWVARLRHVATHVPDKWSSKTEPRLKAYSCSEHSEHEWEIYIIFLERKT